MRTITRTAKLAATACLVAALIVLQVLSPVAAAPQAGAYNISDNGNAADISPGDGLCLTAAATCTLRAAIQEANADGIPSSITFASAMDLSYPALPPLTEDGTTIDASNHWIGTWPNGEPGVTLVGGDPLLLIQSSNNVVRGLEFGGGGLMLRLESSAGANTIGGSEAGQRNVFLGGTGVQIQSSGVGNLVSGNYVGTRDGQNPIPLVGQVGISVRSHSNTIEDNLVVAQGSYGLLLWTAGYNLVQNNIIGLDAAQATALPNGIGVRLDTASYNVIQDNRIAGNTGHGLELRHADYNVVTGNTLGDPFGLGNGGDGLHVFVSDLNQFGGSLAGNHALGNTGYGVWLQGNDNQVLNHTISGNGLDGVRVEQGQRNRIGGSGAVLGNVISHNGNNGIRLAGAAISNTIQGNFIGLTDGVFDAGNQGHGIFLGDGSQQNRIGGLDAEAGNWIAWNRYSGIYMTGATTHDNVLEGNVFGAPVHWGWEAPNGHHGISVYDGAHHNTIGPDNIVVASTWSGVAVVNSDDNVVSSNRVGTNASGAAWGNRYYGVAVVNGAGNSIFSNDIGFNGTQAGEAGVRVDGGLAGNPISANSIHDHTGPGIQLVNGGNFQLGAPALTQAGCLAQPPAPVEVQGLGCLDCTIEIFSDSADEGRLFEGTTPADGATGAFTWSGAVHGPNVTATATTLAGATSPFSAPFVVEACALPPPLLRLFLPNVVR
jgi:parallel beta-helix repeat protein